MPNDKLNIDSLTLDDVLGEGVDTVGDIKDIEDVEDINPQDVEDVEEEVEVKENILEDQDDDSEEYEEDVEETEELSSVAAEIAKTLGFELEGDYEDSVEGLTEMVREVSQNAAEEQLQALFNQFPEIQQHLDYVLAGGDSREFFQRQGQQIDYNSIEVKEEDVSMQRAILAQFLQLKGHDSDFIQDTIDTYEDSGRLFNNAQKAKKQLASYQEEEQKQFLQKQQEEHKRQKEEQEKFWGEVADTIESGNEFAGVRIPDREKSKFFDYISQPIGKNGETQRDLDYQEAGTDIKLAIDYMLYSGFDLNGIIEKKAKTQAAKNLRQRIVSNEERVKSARKQQRRSTNVDFDQLDLGSMLQ